MTTTHAAAQAELAELAHAGRPVSQEEQDSWLKMQMPRYSKPGTPAPIYDWERKAMVSRFDPTTQVSGLARRLLKVSNAASFSGLHRDGAFDEVGASRHARFAFHWGK